MKNTHSIICALLLSISCGVFAEDSISTDRVDVAAGTTIIQERSDAIAHATPMLITEISIHDVRSEILSDTQKDIKKSVEMSIENLSMSIDATKS